MNSLAILSVVLVAIVPMLACVAAAAYLAAHGIGGWGWFLAAAPLLSVSLKALPKGGS